MASPRACALCGDAALAAHDGIGDRGQNSKTAAVYEAEPSLRKRRKEGAASSRRLSVAIWVAAGCLAPAAGSVLEVKGANAARAHMHGDIFAA